MIIAADTAVPTATKVLLNIKQLKIKAVLTGATAGDLVLSADAVVVKGATAVGVSATCSLSYGSLAKTASGTVLPLNGALSLSVVATTTGKAAFDKLCAVKFGGYYVKQTMTWANTTTDQATVCAAQSTATAYVVTGADKAALTVTGEYLAITCVFVNQAAANAMATGTLTGPSGAACDTSSSSGAIEMMSGALASIGAIFFYLF